MFEVFVPGLLIFVFEFLCCVLFNQNFFSILLLLISGYNLISALFPDSKPSIKSSRNDEIPCGWSHYWLNFKDIPINIHDELISIKIPEFHMPIFASWKSIVSIFQKIDWGNWLGMGKNRFDAVSVFQIPYFNIFIGTSRQKNGVIWCDINGWNGEFMSVEFECIFASISVLNVNLIVEQTNCNSLETRTIQSLNYFVLEIPLICLSYSYFSFLVWTYFKKSQLVLLIEKCFGFSCPATCPIALFLGKAFVFSKIPQGEGGRMKDQ